MVVSKETQKDNNNNPIPAAETRRDGLAAEPDHVSLWPEVYSEYQRLAQYHQAKPAKFSHQQQRPGVGGRPLNLHRPGRGRR